MRMQNRIFSAALGLLTAGLAFGQTPESHMPVTLGLKVGVPVTDMMSTGNTSTTGLGASYNSAVPRYILGASAEFHLPLHLRFEVDGLYKRGGFNSSIPFGS